MMPSIRSGSLIRATPPCARMSAGTRSRAITATAPASSAIFACSAVTTSMITPPLSISAMPRLTLAVPVTGVRLGVSRWSLRRPHTSMVGLAPVSAHPRPRATGPRMVSALVARVGRGPSGQASSRSTVDGSGARPARRNVRTAPPPAHPRCAPRDGLVVEPPRELHAVPTGGQRVDELGTPGPRRAGPPTSVGVVERRPQGGGQLALGEAPLVGVRAVRAMPGSVASSARSGTAGRARRRRARPPPAPTTPPPRPGPRNRVHEAGRGELRGGRRAPHEPRVEDRPATDSTFRCRPVEARRRDPTPTR